MNEQIKSPTSPMNELNPKPNNKQTQSDKPSGRHKVKSSSNGRGPVHNGRNFTCTPLGLNPGSFSWGFKVLEWAIPVSHHPWNSGISSGFLQHFHLCSEGSHDCKIYVSSFYMEQHMTVHLLLLLNSLHETLNLNPTCFPHPSSLPKLEHNAKEVLGYILNNLHTKAGSMVVLIVGLSLVFFYTSNGLNIWIQSLFFGAWYDTSNHL